MLLDEHARRFSLMRQLQRRSIRQRTRRQTFGLETEVLKARHDAHGSKQFRLGHDGEVSRNYNYKAVPYVPKRWLGTDNITHGGVIDTS